MNWQNITFGTFLISGLLVASVASAASVSATLYDAPQGVAPSTETMTLTFDGTDIYNPGWAGELNWHSASVQSGGLNSELTEILGSGGTFSTFCIEGTQNVYFGANETWSLGVVTLSSAPSPSPAMGTTKANEITELWDRSFNSIGTNNELAAAFQLAVWEIVNDGIPTLGAETTAAFNNGNFEASGDSTAIGDAVAMLNGITGSGYANTYTVYGLSDLGIQDQIFGVPNGGTPASPAPLPPALPMGLALMGGMGLVHFVRRYRIR